MYLVALLIIVALLGAGAWLALVGAVAFVTVWTHDLSEIRAHVAQAWDMSRPALLGMTALTFVGGIELFVAGMSGAVLLVYPA